MPDDAQPGDRVGPREGGLTAGPESRSNCKPAERLKRKLVPVMLALAHEATHWGGEQRRERQQLRQCDPRFRKALRLPRRAKDAARDQGIDEPAQPGALKAADTRVGNSFQTTASTKQWKRA